VKPSGDQVKKNKLGNTSSTYWFRNGSYRGLVRRPEGKRPLGRPRLDVKIILKWIFK
jgi:hypothetical protein